MRASRTKGLVGVAIHGLLCLLVFAADCDEPLQMHLRRRIVTMIGQDAGEIKPKSLSDALGNLSSIAVENPWWQM